MIDERDRQLIVQYVDGSISDADFRRFQQRLREDAEVRRQLRAELNLESALRDLAAGDSRLAELWNPPGEADGRIDPPADSQRTGNVAVRHWAAAAIAVACVTVSAVVWHLFGGGQVSVQAAATLPYCSSDAVVIDTGGTPRTVRNGLSVGAGDTIKTQGGESFATVAFQDGTRLRIVGDSTVSFSSIEPKRISVLSGMISARVARQTPGRPMVIVTPNDTVEVLGTEFALEASADRTDVRVSRGQVRLTRSKDGRSVLVGRGKRAVSDIYIADMVVHEGGETSDTWEADFENGLPGGWQAGVLVHEGLPEGSSGAVRNVYDSRWNSNLIDTQLLWTAGLFAAQTDTHVHFTFKMQQPGWLNLFVHARTDDDADPTDMFQCNAAPFGGAAADQWYTMTIPLSEWKRNDDVHGRGFIDPPPRVGETIYVMSWSSRKVDRGLVIDRVWVTRGGPGRTEMTKLEASNDEGNSNDKTPGDE